MRKIERIFVHCTAGSQRQSISDLLKEFTRKGWKNPGYHYVVEANGKIHQLLDENKVSNGVQGYNATSINIAYMGGINSIGKPTDNRTDEQKKALRIIIAKVKKTYPHAVIMGHRDIWGKNPSKWLKQCPCFDAMSEYRDI